MRPINFIKILDLQNYRNLLATQGILVATLGIVSLCSCQLNRPSTSSSAFETPIKVITKVPAKEIFLSENISGSFSENDRKIKQGGSTGRFDFYSFNSEVSNITIEIKTYFEQYSFAKTVSVPTIVLMAINGQEIKLKNLYFYLNEQPNEGRPFLHAKWAGKIKTFEKYFLLIASDYSERKKLHSGLTSYFSSVYYNFSKEVLPSEFGDYQFEIDSK